MKYINDYESTTLNIDPVIDEKSGMPKFPSSSLRCRRCIKCNRFYFVNYEFLDYECKSCRKYIEP